MRAPLATTGVLALLALLYLTPVIAPGQLYVLHILTLSLCYAIPAMGLNLLFGYTGLVSLGHMGFAGVGAYTTALLMKSGTVGFVPALAAGSGADRTPPEDFPFAAHPGHERGSVGWGRWGKRCSVGHGRAHHPGSFCG